MVQKSIQLVNLEEKIKAVKRHDRTRRINPETSQTNEINWTVLAAKPINANTQGDGDRDALQLTIPHPESDQAVGQKRLYQ
jgi:hypothetical protein